MRKYTFFVIIITILSVICLAGPMAPAKDKKIARGWRKKEAVTNATQRTDTMVVSSVLRPHDDTVYCMSTIKKGSWQTPNEIVSEKEATELAFVIRLTNKNNAGNYCSLEILKRGLKPNNYGLSLSISEFLPDSIIISNDYIQSISSTHRIDVIPDHTGELVLQERLYDINNQLLGYVVYQYLDGNSTYAEHYFGPDGVPVVIEDFHGHSQGLRSETMTDSHGNDSLRWLTDGRDVIPNKDGAFYVQNILTTNSKGEKIKIQRSLDEQFIPMIDKSGNCGFITIYDSRRRDSIKTNIDNHDNPIAIPKDHFDKLTANVSSQKYQWNNSTGKIDAIEYLGVDGEPVENGFGTHKIVIENDSFGNELSRRGLDLNGNLSQIDGNGTARYTLKWDSSGNIVEYHQYGSDGKPLSPEGYVSSYYKTYDPVTNRLISDIGYAYNNITGKEEQDYKSTYSATIDSLLFSDQTSKIVRYDSSGRVTSIRFFDKNGNPDSDTYCAIDSTCFISGPDVNKSINTEFRADGSVKTVSEYDSLRHTNTVLHYDEQGVLTDSYRLIFNEDGEITGQYDCNGFGIPCRSGGNDGMRYHQSNVTRAIDGNFTSFTIVDEFGEPDYLVVTDGTIYSVSGKNETRFGNRTHSDEWGNAISNDDYGELRDSLPKVMSIEVTDSAAYRLGIRDNDVILQYGDYKPALAHPLSETDFKAQWAIRSALDAPDVKDMVVFRIEDADSGKYGLVRIPSLQGTPSELGFIPHIRFLTERQRNRIMDCMTNSGFSLPDSTYLPDEGHIAVIGYNEMFRSMRNLPYQSIVKDASILLGTFYLENNLSWSGSDEDIEVLSKMIDLTNKNSHSGFPIPQYYFTTNGHNVIPLKTSGRLISCYLTDSDYDKVKDLYGKVISEMDDRLHRRNPMDIHKFEGYWTLASNPSDTMALIPEGYLYFDKNGNIIGETVYGATAPSEKTPEKAGSPVFKITQQVNGKYLVGETLLMFDTDEMPDPLYECIYVRGATTDIDSLTTYFTNDFKEYPFWYKSIMSYDYDISESFIVKSVNKNDLILTDRQGNDLHYIKTKVKPSMPSKPKINKKILQGKWLSEEQDGRVILELSKDGKLQFRMTFDKLNIDEIPVAVQVNVSGKWSIKNNEPSFQFDEDAIKVNILNQGDAIVSEKSEEIYKKVNDKFTPAFIELLKNGKIFGNFKSLTENELIFTDINFTRSL